MSRAQKLEEQLEVLRAIRSAPQEHDLDRELIPFLRAKTSVLIRRAAIVAEENNRTDLGPELIKAFQWLKAEGLKRDRGCEAMLAIVRALITIDHPATDLFFEAAGYVQMEGSFGPPVDAAAPVRGAAVQGLARAGHPDAMYQVIDLLHDPWPPARVGAVRALSDSGRLEAECLLRMQALQGDREADVTSECMFALMRVAPERSAAFVGRFLKHPSEDVASGAALALGDSRHEAAFRVLCEAYESAPHSPVVHAVLVGIGMLRRPEAIDYLIGVLENGPQSAASSALRALEIYSHDESVVARVREAMKGRDILKMQTFPAGSTP